VFTPASYPGHALGTSGAQGVGVGARFRFADTPQGWLWALLGANNRTLARAVEPAPSRADAVRAAAAMTVLASHGRIHVVGDGRSWRWALHDGPALCAVSGTGYLRREDCRRAAAAFRALAVSTPVAESPDDESVAGSRGDRRRDDPASP
jgi:hypothetical protein